MQFRQQALTKLQSPEGLDLPVRFARPQGWLALSVTVVAMAAASVWAVGGSVTSTVAAPAVLTHGQGSYLLQSPVAGQVTAVLARPGQRLAADAPVLAEEIFGPILPVIPYTRLDAPLAAINARSPALALYAFTRSKAAADRIIGSTRSGSVTVNDVVVFMANPNLPFGGVGASGMGAYHGRHSFEVFSHKRAVLRRSFALDASIRYPPFTQNKLALLRRMA